MPQEIEEYVQRIGRTGRLGNQGIATSLFDPDEDYLLIDPIIKTLASVMNIIYLFFSLNPIHFYTFLIVLVQANQEIPKWLLQLGREAKFNDVKDDFDKFGGSDIRIVTNIYTMFIIVFYIMQENLWYRKFFSSALNINLHYK